LACGMDKRGRGGRKKKSSGLGGKVKSRKELPENKPGLLGKGNDSEGGATLGK